MDTLSLPLPPRTASAPSLAIAAPRLALKHTPGALPPGAPSAPPAGDGEGDEPDAYRAAEPRPSPTPPGARKAQPSASGDPLGRAVRDNTSAAEELTRAAHGLKRRIHLRRKPQRLRSALTSAC